MDYNESRIISGIWVSGLMKQARLKHETVRKMLQYFNGLENVISGNTRSILELIEGPPEKIRKAKLYLKNDTVKNDIISSAKQYVREGLKIISIVDEKYPIRLKTISAPPVLLYYKGENSERILSQSYFISVVGTRNPTPYGMEATRKIVSELISRKVVIISGMARGIDSLAHRVALNQNGLTIAVLGCGTDEIYPPENASLMNEIIKKGMIITECPPATKPIKSYFPARNRIISGLADCVAIMEASRKSGTMITAGYAADQGRDLYAVPGSIFSPSSQGTNQLIQDGACVLSKPDDMLWKIPVLYSMSDKDSNDNPSEFSDSFDALRKVLLYTEKSLNEIAQALSISVEKAAEMVSIEELRGRIIYSKGRISLTDSFK